MHIAFTIFVSLLAWYFIGCVVLATVDTRGDLYEWAKKAPVDWGFILVVLLWPIIVWLYLRKGNA